MVKQIAAALALVVLCGCFKVKDELVIEADGSGVVRMVTETSLPPELSGAMSGGRGENSPVLYPPASEDEAKRFFPEKDFKLTTSQKRGKDTAKTTTIEARFTNVNALLNSPYGRAHALTIDKTNGTLRVRALTGAEISARMADFKDETGMMSAMRGMADLEKQKNEMRVEFRVTLPNEVSASNGERNGKSAAWIFERAKAKDGAEFADKVGTVLEATCPADNIAATPVSPPRMALNSFSDLAAGSTGEKAKAIDVAKITNAAKFVPYALHVTRSLDLTGEGAGNENTASLMGAVVIPVELEPQQWGQPKLLEAVDAKGTNLKPAEDESRMFMSRTTFGDDDEDAEEKKTTRSEVRRMVTLSFQPPDWKAKEIAKIKGSIALKYPGGTTEIVKLSNAVPAKAMIDAAKGMRGFDSNERVITEPRLEALGLKLKLQNAMKQTGMIMLTLGAEGSSASISDVQVFDVNGRPWPTFVQPMNFGSSDEGVMLNVMVAGQPTPPLSLALQASGSGQNVELPIQVEKVPVRGK